MTDILQSLKEKIAISPTRVFEKELKDGFSIKREDYKVHPDVMKLLKGNGISYYDDVEVDHSKKEAIIDSLKRKISEEDKL